MMADALRMLLAMALFFGAMWLYAISPEIIERYKQKKKAVNKLKKEKNRHKEIALLKSLRDEKNKLINDRRARIKEHLNWLKDLNEKVKERQLSKQEKATNL